MTGNERQSILIDGRAFSLQSKGGVSQVWAKLLQDPVFRQRFRLYLLVYPGYEKNIHLQESNVLKDPDVVKVVCDIPSSDNHNHSSPSSIEKRRKLCLSACGGTPPDIVINTYYGENVLPDSPRYVVMVHDFAHEDLEIFSKRPTTKKVIERKLQAMRTATDLIYISCFSRNRALRLYPDLKDKRSVVIYHGHDQLPEAGAGCRDKTFVHVGTRGLYKDFATVAEAFRRFLPNHPEASLTVIGGEAPDAELEMLLADFPAQVTFETNVSDQQITEAIASARGFISASEYEGFGIPLLNALHLGTRPIVSNIPPYRELASHYAYFFSPKDAAQLHRHLEASLAERDAMMPRAYRPWSHVAREYVDFIGSAEHAV